MPDKNRMLFSVQTLIRPLVGLSRLNAAMAKPQLGGLLCSSANPDGVR